MNMNPINYGHFIDLNLLPYCAWWLAVDCSIRDVQCCYVHNHNTQSAAVESRNVLDCCRNIITAAGTLFQYKNDILYFHIWAFLPKWLEAIVILYTPCPSVCTSIYPTRILTVHPTTSDGSCLCSTTICLCRSIKPVEYGAYLFIL